MAVLSVPEAFGDFAQQIRSRLDAIDVLARQGAYDAAIELLTRCVASDGVVHAFGTGHSEGFAMELAGRAGGLVPTNKVALRDVALIGDRPIADLDSDPPLERDPDVADDLWATIVRGPADVFVIASNSGINGSVVGLALHARDAGHPVIAVTSLAHTAAVTPSHPSGLRLAEIADLSVDNHAPYGDATMEAGLGAAVGAVSSITAAYLAQLLTIGTTARLLERGIRPPVYLSANIPDGPQRNQALESHYAGRIRRSA